MNRRELLIGSAAAIGATIVSPIEKTSAQKSQEVIFNGAGGSWQENVRKAWLAPFSSATGVKVIDTFPFELGKMETMVRINNVAWDITDCPSAFLSAALDRNLVEPLDYSVIDRSLLSPENYGDRYVAYSEFSANIVYDKRRIPGPEVPTSWKDYWDLNKFPGPRSFRKNPLMALESALLADGVAAEKLYPLDLDRAFRKLDEIKKDVRWWSDAQQSVQLIANGEVIMGVTFGSRAIQGRATFISVMETPYAAAASALVGEGLGISIISPLTARDFVGKKIVARPFVPAIPFPTSLIWLKERPLSKLTQAFIRTLKEHRDGCLRGTS